MTAAGVRFPSRPLLGVQGRVVRQTSCPSLFADVTVDFLPTDLPGVELLLAGDAEVGQGRDREPAPLPPEFLQALADGLRERLAEETAVRPTVRVVVRKALMHETDSNPRSFTMAGRDAASRALMCAPRSVGLSAPPGIYINALLRESGELVFDGHDLRKGEYEYAITVAARDLPVVADALGVSGATGDELLATLADQGAEIVRCGERAWLLNLGLQPGFWSHGEWW